MRENTAQRPIARPLVVAAVYAVTTLTWLGVVVGSIVLTRDSRDGQAGIGAMFAMLLGVAAALLPSIARAGGLIMPATTKTARLRSEARRPAFLAGIAILVVAVQVRIGPWLGAVILVPLVAAPFVYALVHLVAGGAYLRAQRPNPAYARWSCGLGITGGVLLGLAAIPVFAMDREAAWWLVALGALAGLVVGSTFWRVGLRSSSYHLARRCA